MSLVAYHWAVKVGDHFFEIEGASMTEKGKGNCVLHGQGSTAKSGVQEWVEIGTTTCTCPEMTTFIISWLKEHPVYHINGDNCQLFGHDFAVFLCGEDVHSKLPAYDHFKSVTSPGMVVGAGARIGLVAAGLVEGPLLAVPTAIGAVGFGIAASGVKAYQWGRGFNSFPEQLESTEVPYREITSESGAGCLADD